MHDLSTRGFVSIFMTCSTGLRWLTWSSSVVGVSCYRFNTLFGFDPDNATCESFLQVPGTRADLVEFGTDTPAWYRDAVETVYVVCD